MLAGRPISPHATPGPQAGAEGVRPAGDPRLPSAYHPDQGDTMTAAPTPALTDRFTRAVDYARIAHAGQVRKGTSIPYLTHLLGVATLVIEHGGSEDQAIAGLLHDTPSLCHRAMRCR